MTNDAIRGSSIKIYTEKTKLPTPCRVLCNSVPNAFKKMQCVGRIVDVNFYAVPHNSAVCQSGGGLGNHPSLYKIFPLNVERSKQMLIACFGIKKAQLFHFLAHCLFFKLTSP